MIPVPRAVLLDAFGTLVELEPPGPRLRVALRERAGVEVTEDQAAQAIAAEVEFYRAHHDAGRDATSLAELRRRCAEVTRDALPAAARGLAIEQMLPILIDSIRFRAFPEVPGALRALRAAGARLVVVSNWDVSLGEALADAGLAALLDGAVSSAEAGAPKPGREIFDRALALARASAGEAIHVGDSVEHDVAGAWAAGIEAVLVRRDGAAGPAGVRTVASLAELVPPPAYSSAQ
ncbi:MAG: putative hydrolase of the superfamily [Solirubrobacteraceae bacterium]|nr:putative hydrolase of the superfamily [Solirubrobacteraceae bacterium]